MELALELKDGTKLIATYEPGYGNCTRLQHVYNTAEERYITMRYGMAGDGIELKDNFLGKDVVGPMVALPEYKVLIPYYILFDLKDEDDELKKVLEDM